MAGSENNQTERSPLPQGASQNGAGSAPPASPAPMEKSKPNPVAVIVMVVAIIVAGFYGYRFFQYSTTHVETDDAYVTGDLINVSPVVPGTLARLTVDEGDVVKQGQIVARLDDGSPRAAYQQALAEWKAAESQIPQAQTNLAFTAETTLDQIKQAEAGLAAQNAKVDQEGRRVVMTAEQSSSQLAEAQAQAAAALEQVQTARAQHATALAAVRTAQAAAAAARQQVAAAQANATRAHRDAVRYAALYGTNGTVGAVTAQQYDASVAADQTATAQLGAAQEQAQQAQEAIAQAQAAADAANAAVNAAKSQAAAAQSATFVAKAGLLQVPVQKGAYVSSKHTATQSSAALGLAQAGSEQVKLRQQMIDTYRAQAQAAKQAAALAKVALDDTVIAAPSDGVVVKKGANVGDAIQPGQTLFTMTRGLHVWVTANFKETQVEHMHPGQVVDITVDAYPSLTYRGIVSSINEASGNATALLPADNATGNFTKVVQRIPVKIELQAQPSSGAEHYATQADVDRLRQGMSVTAAVEISRR